MPIDTRPLHDPDVRGYGSAREQLRREQERISFALEAAGMVAWEWNPATDALSHSRNAEQVLGLPPGTTLHTGKELVARIYPEDRERVQQARQRALDQRSEYSEEFRIVRADHAVIWVADRGQELRGTKGESGCMSGVLMDISERKRVEERARSVLSSITEAYFVLDEGFRFVDVNPAALRMIFRNMSAAELIGRVFWDLFPEGRTTEFYRQYHRAMAEQHEVHFEGKSNIVDGWFETHAYPRNGVLEVYVRDITDRKRAEAALREIQERFEAFMENSPAQAWMKDEEGRYIYLNREIVEAYQEQRSEVLGKTDFDIFPRAIAEQLRANDAAVRDRGQAVRFVERVLRPDGERFVLAFKFPFQSGKGRQLVGGIGLDITEQRQTEEALKEADRRKDEFLATLAHELRNPLAPIRNAVQILSMQGMTAPELRWAREVIDRQTQQLTRLVDDLLDVSRITRGKIALRKERVDLAVLLERAVETSRPLIDRCGHELTVRVPAEPVYLEVDPTRLAQVVANLLNNAAKFTPARGHIELSAGQDGGEVVIRVRDSGIGMARPMLAQAFDMFIQGDTSLERVHGGLGIGLTIVKRLVELHGGTVEAHSAGAGQGSELVVRLPAAPAAPEEAPRQEDGRPRAPLASRILVVDDNLDAADSLGMLLEVMGYEVRVAHDGQTALSVADCFRPDVMVLDLGMPGMSGYEVARQVRRSPALRHVFLVALTGWGQQDDRRRTRDAGFDQHLVKPVDLDTLRDLLASLGTRA